MNEQAISFVVPAIPIAQPRPRAVRFGGSARMVSNPNKHPVTAFKATVAMAAQEHCDTLIDGPIGLWLTFVLPRPTSKIWKTKPMPRLWHTVRPDVDNLEKSTCDALKGVVWRDDSQVCWTQVQKLIAAGDEQPHVEVTITLLKEFEACFASFPSKNLIALDDGRVSEAWRQAVKRAATDCEDRPGANKARKVTLELEMVPVMEQSILDTIEASFKIKESVPTRESKTYSLGVRRQSGQLALVFNDMSDDNIHQRTIDEVE